MDPNLQRILDELNQSGIHEALRQIEELQALRNQLLLHDWSAVSAAREIQRVQAEQARSMADANISSIQNLLESFEVRSQAANALNVWEQVSRDLNPDLARTAIHVAEQLAQARQQHLDQAIRQLQSVDPASILNQAIETLSSAYTRALIEQASANALREYASRLAEIPAGELAYEPTIEESTLDWIFELDKQSLRVLCRVLIAVFDGLQVVVGVYAVTQPGPELEKALVLLNSVRILLAYALTALQEKDE